MMFFRLDKDCNKAHTNCNYFKKDLFQDGSSTSKPGSGTGRGITNLKTEVNSSVLLFNLNIQGIQNKIDVINIALLIGNIHTGY